MFQNSKFHISHMLLRQTSHDEIVRAWKGRTLYFQVAYEERILWAGQLWLAWTWAILLILFLFISLAEKFESWYGWPKKKKSWYGNDKRYIKCEYWVFHQVYPHKKNCELWNFSRIKLKIKSFLVVWSNDPMSKKLNYKLGHS